jgi:hypothetical protein
VAFGPVVRFFLLFAAPSALLAFLAVREFLLRARGPPGARVRRASVLMLVAAALPAAMVVLTVGLTGGAPLTTSGGQVFLGYGAVCALLGPVGVWLFHRAAGTGQRRLVKAAETVPLLLVMLNLVLVANAAAQIP